MLGAPELPQELWDAIKKIQDEKRISTINDQYSRISQTSKMLENTINSLAQKV